MSAYTVAMNLAITESELPLRLRFEQPMTDEELMRFCAANDLLRVEREANGELIVMSPSGSEGGGVDTDVTVEMSIWARQDGRGKVFGSNAGFRLPDGSVRAADCHWVSWIRWNALTSEDQKRYAPLCPEFVIEVRSESDRLPELQAKMQMWLANGAELAWLIDPKRKAVEIYRPGREVEVLQGGSAVEGEGPVAGFVLELGRVWG
jgi:Uma2 family endonuclease